MKYGLILVYLSGILLSLAIPVMTQEREDQTKTIQAKEKLIQVFENTAKAKNYRIESTMTIEISNGNEEGKPRIESSTIKGIIKAPDLFHVIITISAIGLEIEIYRQGDNVVMKNPMTGEWTKMTDFQQRAMPSEQIMMLKEHLKDVKFTGQEHINQKDCVVIEAVLDCESLQKAMEKQIDQPSETTKITYEKAQLKAWCGKENSLFHKVCVLTETTQEGAGEEKTPQKITSKTEITYSGYDEEINLEIPDEVKKILEGDVPAKDKETLVEVIRLTSTGNNLSDEAANELEKVLQEKPDDLDVRTQLLGYYQLKAFQSASAKEKRQKHIIWIIQNRPEAKIAGFPCADLDPIIDKKVYYQAKELWLKQVETNKDNTAIMGNAADFLLIFDRAIAESLLQKAKTLEPENPKWSERLGFLYQLNDQSLKSNKEKKEAVQKALRQIETAVEKAGKGGRFYQLSKLAEIAFDAGDIEKAKRYATELLDMASQYERSWYYGNAIHEGNLVLGRIALKSHNVEEAKSFLLKAGETPGSLHLNTLGPNMSLAKELLEQNEKEIVIQYLKLCKKFWKIKEILGKDVLNDWIKTIEAGNIPDFSKH